MLDIDRLLILVGLIMVMVGLLTWSGVLDWFGRLPGDVRSERPGFRFYLPLTSLVVASVVFNLLILAARLFLP